MSTDWMEVAHKAEAQCKEYREALYAIGKLLRLGDYISDTKRIIGHVEVIVRERQEALNTANRLQSQLDCVRFAYRVVTGEDVTVVFDESME